MSLSPIAYADSLRIGTIDFVSPDGIKVLLDIEAPDAVALNTGTPRPFPRINGYVLVPSDQGHLVAQVEWITVERSQYPKRKGMQDFGLVDLPYPLRKMSLNPLGCLIYEGRDGDKDRYAFQRGVEAYPTVGDPVLLPTQSQLRAIVESGENRRVKIGTSPLAANAEVRIDPDRLFGRHLAVLGNTGSGKSCSVAGLIRWSMDEARKARGGTDPNARFIVLDPNGEYANTFRDMSKVRVFAVEPAEGVEQLQVPLWFWNSTEWSAFTQASGKAQRPALQKALRQRRNEKAAGSSAPTKESLLSYLQGAFATVQQEIANGSPFATSRDGKYWGFIELLGAIHNSLETFRRLLPDDADEIGNIIAAVSLLKDQKCKNDRGYNKPFEYGDIQEFTQLIQSAIEEMGGDVAGDSPTHEDVPRPFRYEDLLTDLEFIATNSGNRQWFDSFLSRIRTLLSDSRMNSVCGHDNPIHLDDWLRNYIGDSQASNGSVTIIDLSLTPAEVVHIITAVIARMTLEALQRYRKLSGGRTLPTVLVMEEAHSFVRRYKDDAEDQNSAAICCQVFEKIAREGRKFGLGLVLSSQRPSELSPTVLSQCNSYLLHRISNDRDQELVHKLVPDNLRGLLRDLPSLPPRNAILLGWASELPMLVQINALPDHHRPKSDDPDFWAVWSGKGVDENGKEVAVVRDIDWKAIADDWQQLTLSNDTDDTESGSNS